MPSSYVVGEQQLRCASASEVIRDGPPVLEDQGKFGAVKLAALRADIQKGADSGSGLLAEKVFARLEAKYGPP